MNMSVANAVTVLRIILSPLLVVIDPFSWGFVVLFIMCGISDITDGWIARRTATQSDFGGRLDSVADLIMFIALAWVVISHVGIPIYVWCLIAFVAIVKCMSIVIGIRHGFSGLRHSALNKITGLVIFLSIPLMLHWEAIPVEIVVCCVAIIASLNELSLNLHDVKVPNGC